MPQTVNDYQCLGMDVFRTHINIATLCIDSCLHNMQHDLQHMTTV